MTSQVSVRRNRHHKKRNDSAPSMTHVRESQLSRQTQFTCVLLPEARLLLLSCRSGQEGSGSGRPGHSERNPLSSVNLKLLIAVPVPGGRIPGMQPEATGGSSRAGQVTGCTSPSGQRELPLSERLFPGAKHKACSSRLVFNRENKTPCVPENLYFPWEEWGVWGGGGEATQETWFQQELEQVPGMAVGSLCTKPGEERVVT